MKVLRRVTEGHHLILDVLTDRDGSDFGQYVPIVGQALEVFPHLERTSAAAAVDVVPKQAGGQAGNAGAGASRSA